ncbi:hypothetical protein HMPREF0972_02547 [Actinomyces sp. oral taxon 848 str. F0332]|nr:hypothetical protein HMPREF0972_02547 [Actinomyces sp. oral taxon 848 str. F0332]
MVVFRCHPRPLPSCRGRGLTMKAAPAIEHQRLSPSTQTPSSTV